jgi:hypothetical protein
LDGGRRSATAQSRWVRAGGTLTRRTGGMAIPTGENGRRQVGPHLPLICSSQKIIQPDQISSNTFEFKFLTHSNFDRSKKYFPMLGKLEIKYGCEGFVERNIFPYRNFSHSNWSLN